MATTDGVSAICEAIVHILRSTMNSQRGQLNLPGAAPAFHVFTAKDFSSPPDARRIETGASVFLYRVLPNLTHRTPAGRVQPNGTRQRAQLPLDLNIIVTVWGDDPKTQNRLVGWVLRTLEDYPLLPATILNHDQGRAIFQPDETVALTLSEMGGGELLQFWEILGEGESYYRVSIPYIIRNLMIESSHSLDAPVDVQMRELTMHRLDPASRLQTPSIARRLSRG